MPKYNVLVACEWAGSPREVGDELEMAESEAGELLAGGFIEQVKPAASDELSEDEAGKPVSQDGAGDGQQAAE